MEFGFIILWDNHRTILDIIHELTNNYNNLVQVGIKKIKFNIEEKHIKLNQLYETTLDKSDARVNDKPLLILIFKDTSPIYSIEKTEGTKTIKFVNKKIFNIKKTIRKIYDSRYIHATDDIEEANLLCSVFDLMEFHINIGMANIEKYLCNIFNSKIWEFKSIENTPHYKCINGDEAGYVNYITNIYPTDRKVETLYNLKDKLTMENYNSNNDLLIVVSNINNKLCIRDGIHRASCLYKLYVDFINNTDYIKKTHGEYRNIDLKFKYNVVSQNIGSIANYLLNKNYLIEHRIIYNKVLKILNANCNYIIARGFDYLPDKPNTDLDIIFKSKDDYNKFIEKANILFKNCIITKNKYSCNNCIYHQIITNKNICQFLPDGYFHIDLYSNIPYNINSNLTEFIFSNKLLQHNYSIPSVECELLLFVLRVKEDLNGIWKDKYKKRINIIKLNIDNNKLEKMFKLIENKEIINTVNEIIN